ncbi:hypothetical protein FOL46_002492 [Perkinsus olseni]|uniref:Uncharacterized protein n=1 Tax=Perkinsus olseni TaxID=32597 RepID=A0A7J6MUX6_PEROL|nr:hypothetical protein FOL46_002492 [Perkinsus olseni]
MVRGTFNLALDLRACERVFQRMGHRLADPRYLTAQFFGRRDPRGLGIPTRQSGAVGAGKCCSRCNSVNSYSVEHSYDAESETLDGLLVSYGTGRPRRVDLPITLCEFTESFFTYSPATLHFLARSVEETQKRCDLWELDVATLKWRKLRKLEGHVEDCEMFEMAVTSSGMTRVGAIWMEDFTNNITELLLWDGDEPPRKVVCDGAKGCVDDFCFVTPEVLLVSTRKGDAEDVGQLFLCRIEEDGLPTTLCSIWWISELEPARLCMSHCGHSVELEEELLHPQVKQLNFNF